MKWWQRLWHEIICRRCIIIGFDSGHGSGEDAVEIYGYFKDDRTLVIIDKKVYPPDMPHPKGKL